jgi:Aspartyl protease
MLSLVAFLLPRNVAAFVATSIVSSQKQLLSSHKDTTDLDELDDPLLVPKPSRSPSRRDVLQSAIKANILGTALTASSESVLGATSPTLLADLPMIRLKLPSNGLGRDYIATKICLSGDKTSQPVEFMIDTGLSLEMITPHLRDELGLRSIRTRLQGLTAAGANQGGTEMVDLVDASLCQSTDGSAPSTVASTMPLPTLHAVVGDFPQEHMDPKHDPVEGMLGLEVLSLYDVDFDFASERIRLYQPGTAVTNAVGKEMSKLVEIPALVINDTGILGIRVTTPTSKQPILGFLDCGSSFSVVNWKAAEILGLPPKSDSVYKKGPKIAAFGVDGRPIELSTLKQELSFLGDAKRDAATGQLSGFVEPPPSWKNWDPVYLAVGDLPVFPELLGDGVRPYTGPAALIGLDILAQRRFILESAAGNKENTRRRRIFVSCA